jgi:hypothetical protein
VPIQKLFLLSTASHAQKQPYWATLRKGLEGFRRVIWGKGLRRRPWPLISSVNQANESRVEHETSKGSSKG